MLKRNVIDKTVFVVSKHAGRLVRTSSRDGTFSRKLAHCNTDDTDSAFYAYVIVIFLRRTTMGLPVLFLNLFTSRRTSDLKNREWF